MAQSPCAADLLAESLATQSRLLGTESLHYAILADGYAMIELSLARGGKREDHLTNAKHFFEVAASTYKRLLTADDPGYAGAIDGLGMAALLSGDYINSRALLTRAEQIRRKVLGLRSRDYAISLIHRAMLDIEENELDSAGPLIEDALTIALDFQQLRSDCLVARARISASRGDHAEACDRYSAAIRLIEGSAGRAHPDLVIPLRGYAASLGHLGRHAEADRSLARASEIWSHAEGKNARSTHD